MSTPSITASVYSCAHPRVNGENATRAQSARFFDPALNVVSTTCRSANENHAGRPAGQNSDNGQGNYGTMSGFAGLNPSDWVLLSTGLRQVSFMQEAGNPTTFYDTIGGANRSNWPSQFAGAGKTCAVLGNGPSAYTSAPQQNNCYGQVGATSVDRNNYMRALNQVYRNNSLGQY
jgi:hypothetical protein